MGRFSVEFEVTNRDDLALARHGAIRPDQIRRVRLRGVVDSGATRLVLPKKIVDQLGLPVTGRVGVRYADGRKAIRSTVDGVHVKLLGRSSDFKAAVEPYRKSALIGAIVLEDLDFLIDPTRQRLMPRDPKMIISEAE
jgi:predicted aspartyl protease